jgi:hypothetical protein
MKRFIVFNVHIGQDNDYFRIWHAIIYNLWCFTLKMLAAGTSLLRSWFLSYAPHVQKKKKEKLTQGWEINKREKYP